MTQENQNLLGKILIESYQHLSEDISTGYMLIDTSFQIIHANAFCRKFLDIPDANIVESLKVFKSMNKQAVQLINKRIYNTELLLKINDHIIEHCHNLMLHTLLPLNFIYFAVYQGRYISLLVNFIPVTDKEKNLAFIQVFISHYDFWGHTDLSELYNRDHAADNYMKIMNEDTLPIHLSERQAEIVFILAHGAGVREAAEQLKMSYGALTSTLKNYIYPKFNIHSNNIDDLVKKISKMGYAKLIPQSLCNPITVILDAKIREQYFYANLKR